MSSNIIALYAALKNLSATTAAPATGAPVAAPTTAAAKEKKPAKAKAEGGAEKAGQPQRKKAGQQASADQDKVTFDADKDNDFPLWFEQICVMAEMVDKRYPVKGMPVMRPYGFYMHSVIMRLVEAEWEALGTQLCQFPALIPESFLSKEKEHIKGFEAECFWVTHGGLDPLEERLALRPTSETAMYYMFAKWVRSYRDLPLQVHQSCAVYRHETKDTRPLIRIREIHWNEAHTCHATAQEALDHLEDAWKGYLRALTEKLGMTGKRLRRPEWDKFAGAEHTDVMDSVMPDGKVLQTIGAHYLGQKFAKVFDIKFLNKSQQPEFAYMTCYGVSTRTLAATIAAHGDKKGLVLPAVMAKWQVVIIPIITTKATADVPGYTQKVFAALKQAGLRVEVDDSDKKPGDKYYHWEMKGVPIRMEIGPKDVEANVVTLVRRDTGEKSTASFEGLADHLQQVFVDQLNHLRAKSIQYLKDHITDCTSLEQAAEVLKTKGGFARIPFCSMGHDGKDGDIIVHDKTGGEVRGCDPFEAAPPAGTLCVATGKPATVYGYVAKAY